MFDYKFDPILLRKTPGDFTKLKDYTLESLDPLPIKNLASRVKLAKSFDGLNVLTTFRAKDIEQLIALLVLNSSINPDNLSGAVLDFGMGTGPGAYILNQYGGDIIGVDSSAISVQTAITEGILPAERALVQDGFEYLNSVPPNALDLVTAFMMPSGFAHHRLYHESQRVLKTGGQLLLTGGLRELAGELRRTVGMYGKIEDVITSIDNTNLGHVAFTYTK